MHGGHQAECYSVSVCTGPSFILAHDAVRRITIGEDVSEKLLNRAFDGVVMPPRAKQMIVKYCVY